MATQSTSPANAQSPPAVGSEVPGPAGGNGNTVKEDTVHEPSGKPLFTISEPLREDQVQNAVKFLSHPRVRGSPVIHRRSFLEKKGLTKEEIDEAFRRVPDPPPDTKIEASATKPAAQANSVTALHPHAPAQAPQSVVPPSNGVTTVTTLQKYRFQWSHALFAIGVLAASGAGTAVLFKKMVVPRLKGWIRKVVTEENESPTEDKSKSMMVEEAAEAAKAAASAAAVIAEASKELLSAKTEERKYFDAFMGALDVQVKEMKSMSDAIQRLESRREDRFYQEKPTGDYIQPTSGNGPTNPSWRTSQHVQVNGTSYTDFEGRPSSAPAYMNPTSAPAYMNPTSAPAYMNPTSAPYSNSYMPGMNMPVAQKGEKSSGFKPWEVNQQIQERRSYSLQSQSTDEEFRSEAQGTFQSSQVNGNAQDNSDPWLKRKNVKITEVDSELAEARQFPYGNDAAQKPKPRAWLPPQPPSVVMPEAAAAIRQPKSSQKQSSGDDLSTKSSVDGEDGEPRGEMNSGAQMENLDSSVPDDYGRDGIREERVDGIETS